MRHLILLRSWKKVEVRGEGEFLRARTRRARALLALSNSPSSPSPSPSNNCQAVLPLLFRGATSFFPHQFSPVISILLPWGKHRISFKSDCNPATRIGYVRKLSRYSNICSQIGHCGETIGEGGTTLDLKALHLGAVIFLFLFVFPFFFFCLFSLYKDCLSVLHIFSAIVTDETTYTTHSFFCRKIINRRCRKMVYKGKTL